MNNTGSSSRLYRQPVAHRAVAAPPQAFGFDSVAAIVILTFFFISVIIFGAYLVYTSTNEARRVSIFIIISSLLFAGFLIRVVMSKKYGAADLLVAYFFLFSFAFVGLYQNVVQVFPWRVVHDDESVFTACVVFSLFLFCYFIARESRVPTNLHNLHIFDDRKAIIVIAFLLLLSATAFLVAGPENVLNPRSALDLTTDGIGPQLAAIGRPLALVSLLFLFGYIRRRGVRLSIVPMLAMSLAMTYVWYNPVSTPRLHFVALIFSLLVIASSLWSMSASGKSALCIALFALNYVALGPLKSLSDGLGRANVSFYDNVLSSVRIYAFRVDFDVFQTASNGALYVTNYGYLYLKPILGLIGFLVPRALWPDKPTGSGLLVHERLGYVYTNLSYPLPIEAYTAGGYIAVAIVGVAAGLFMKSMTAASRGVDLAKSSSAAPIIYAVVAGYMPIILRGSINSVFPLFGVAFIGLALMTIISRRTHN